MVAKIETRYVARLRDRYGREHEPAIITVQVKLTAKTLSVDSHDGEISNTFIGYTTRFQKNDRRFHKTKEEAYADLLAKAVNRCNVAAEETKLADRQMLFVKTQKDELCSMS